MNVELQSIPFLHDTQIADVSNLHYLRDDYTEQIGEGSVGAVFTNSANDSALKEISLANPDQILSKDYKDCSLQELEVRFFKDLAPSKLSKLYHSGLFVSPMEFEPLQIFKDKNGKAVFRYKMENLKKLGYRDFAKSQIIKDNCPNFDNHVSCFDIKVQTTWKLLNFLKYLKINKIVHGDLKPENIMFDSSGNLKLMDFSLAYEAKDIYEPRKISTKNGLPGSMQYFSPQEYIQESRSANSDLDSMGRIISMMFLDGTEVLHPSAKVLSEYKKNNTVDWIRDKFENLEEVYEHTGYQNDDELVRKTNEFGKIVQQCFFNQGGNGELIAPRDVEDIIDCLELYMQFHEIQIPDNPFKPEEYSPELLNSLSWKYAHEPVSLYSEQNVYKHNPRIKRLWYVEGEKDINKPLEVYPGTEQKFFNRNLERMSFRLLTTIKSELLRLEKTTLSRDVEKLFFSKEELVQRLNDLYPRYSKDLESQDKFLTFLKAFKEYNSIAKTLDKDLPKVKLFVSKLFNKDEQMNLNVFPWDYNFAKFLKGNSSSSAAIASRSLINNIEVLDLLKNLSEISDLLTDYRAEEFFAGAKVKDKNYFKHVKNYDAMLKQILPASVDERLRYIKSVISTYSENSAFGNMSLELVQEFSRSLGEIKKVLKTINLLIKYKNHIENNGDQSFKYGPSFDEDLHAFIMNNDLVYILDSFVKINARGDDLGSREQRQIKPNEIKTELTDDFYQLRFNYSFLNP